MKLKKTWIYPLIISLLYSCDSSSSLFSSSIQQSSSDSFSSESSISSESSLENKKLRISILGDSISTYDGYSNDKEVNSIGNNAVWFPNTNYVGADLPVEETWWMRAINSLDAELCCNNSYSGSCITSSLTYNLRFKYLDNLKLETSPDVIIIYMGINDFSAKYELGDNCGLEGEEEQIPRTPLTFSAAYLKTLVKLKQKYSEATIFCCTPTLDRKRQTTSRNGDGVEEEPYFERIKTIASNTGCQVIDLYHDCGIDSSNISQYTVDKLHPNSAGMEKIANCVSTKISSYYSSL